jgi:hypothetical protein
MSAGHRPCAECQHARYRIFREIWAASNFELLGTPSPSADEIDRILHAERVDVEGRKRTYYAQLSELPPGAMVADNQGLPYLVLAQRLLRWEPGGYGRSIPKPISVVSQVLTPRSIVRAITQGYPVTVHSSAMTVQSSVTSKNA